MSPVKNRLTSSNNNNAGDSLVGTSPKRKTAKLKPRDAIRDDISLSDMNECTPICGKGVHSKYMFAIEKLVTKFQRLAFHYQHRFYIRPRLTLYLFAIVFAGMLKYFWIDYQPEDSLLLYIKTPKKFFLNVYFVKLGWLWTLISLVPFYLLTRFVFCKRAQDDPNSQTKNFWLEFLHNCLKAFVPLGVCTVIWYITTQSFVLVENAYGTCILNPALNSTTGFTNRYECRKHGHQWDTKLEISGHIFLMVFSNLMRVDELYYLFDQFVEFKQFKLHLIEQTRMSNYTEPYHFTFRSPFLVFTLICVVIMTLVTLIFDFMIIETSLFYHNGLQNVAALGIAFFWWWFIYRLPRLASNRCK